MSLKSDKSNPKLNLNKTQYKPLKENKFIDKNISKRPKSKYLIKRNKIRELELKLNYKIDSIKKKKNFTNRWKAIGFTRKVAYGQTVRGRRPLTTKTSRVINQKWNFSQQNSIIKDNKNNRNTK